MLYLSMYVFYTKKNKTDSLTVIYLCPMAQYDKQFERVTSVCQWFVDAEQTDRKQTVQLTWPHARGASSQNNYFIISNNDIYITELSINAVLINRKQRF